MAEVEIKFDSKAAEKWFSGIQKGVDRAGDAHKDYVDAISAFVVADVTRHFEDERGAKGPWKRWSDIYASHMARIGKGGNQILQDTGRLKNSFKPTNYTVGKGQVTWYNDAKTKKGFPYAYAHDEGGPILPKRDFMWLSDDAMKKISSITMAYILGGKR